MTNHTNTHTKNKHTLTLNFVSNFSQFVENNFFFCFNIFDLSLNSQVNFGRNELVQMKMMIKRNTPNKHDSQFFSKKKKIFFQISKLIFNFSKFVN